MDKKYTIILEKEGHETIELANVDWMDQMHVEGAFYRNGYSVTTKLVPQTVAVSELSEIAADEPATPENAEKE